MKIKILHLFYDFLNLYGDSANSLAIYNYFIKQNIPCELIKHKLNEDVDLQEYDIIYVGSGEDSKIKIATHNILKYKKIFKELIKNKFLLTTGNSIRLFNNDALGIVDVNIKILNKHQVYEAILNHPEINGELIGFYNHNCQLEINEKNLFNLVYSKDKKLSLKSEGFFKDNMYSTLSIGPFYVRNYQFLKYICNKIILDKYPDFKIKDIDFDLEKKALDQFISNYYKEYKKSLNIE